MQNTGAVISKLRELVDERREYLMRCFLNGLPEPVYYQNIGEIRGLDWVMTNLEDITKRD